MVLRFLKALVLVAIGVAGTAALTWGLISGPAAPEAPAMIIAGLVIYAFAWTIGLYVTSK